MQKLTYLAILEPAGSGYSVYFPDLPGCISYGDTYEVAIEQAQEALALHIYGMEKDADQIPEPSSIVIADPETAQGYIVSPVTVYPTLVRMEMDNRSVKTNLTIPAWLKEIAEDRGVNFSKLLQVALMDYLGIKDSTLRGIEEIRKNELIKTQ